MCKYFAYADVCTDLSGDPIMKPLQQGFRPHVFDAAYNRQ